MTPPAFLRPEPLLRTNVRPLDPNLLPAQAAARLQRGERLLVTDQYSRGVEILTQLQALLGGPAGDASYADRQAARRAHRSASLRLLAPITDHQVALAGAQPIPFLKELYPDLQRFFLPLVQIQELHGASERYREGTHLAVLGHRIHPFYGTYVPTRVAHLELFATWLHQYAGPRARAVDVGTGCGVLALMLCKAGFGQVLATDNNPNAIESVARELKRRPPPPPPIRLFCGDLLPPQRGDGPAAAADLIVFNPPWTRGSAEGILDQALYFDDDLFERFFAQACARITPTGRIVLLFSNIIQLVQPDVPHPILAELEKGRLRLVQKMHRKIIPDQTRDGPRRRTREQVEVWELAPVDPAVSAHRSE